MTPEPDSTLAIQKRQRALVDLLSAWVAIPSVSTDPKYAEDVHRSAEFLGRAAVDAGFQRAEVWETEGLPALFAERLEDPALPTVLVYGHHDVQPVDPVSEWLKAPFEALERDGELLGRGSSDDKGQLAMHLEAVRGILDARGHLPINLKLIAEGEEENGSGHFDGLLRAHREELRADVVVVSDTGMLGEDLPSLTIALRGNDYWELRVQTADTDMHSGVYGGAVLNPIQVLVEMLSKLHDGDGHIAVPGFYDDVVELDAATREELAAVPFDETRFLANVGAVPGGEQGFTSLERRTARPTLELCGIWGGYEGEGAKTVIPARAGAKLSSRLVPQQDPARITRVVGEQLRRLTPEGVRAEFKLITSGRWALTSSDHPSVAAAADVVEGVWGRPPLFTREGGSIPPVTSLGEVLEAPCVLFGVALPDDHFHAPNERVVLAQLFRGMEALGRLWDRYGAMGREALTAAPG